MEGGHLKGGRLIGVLLYNQKMTQFMLKCKLQ